MRDIWAKYYTFMRDEEMEAENVGPKMLYLVEDSLYS